MQVLDTLPVIVESGRSFHELYPVLLETILERGRKAAPRGEATHEVTPFVFTIEDPSDCIAIQRCRRMNYAYAIIEKLSLVHGAAEPEAFCFYIPRLRQLLNDDGVFEGAYAPRLSKQLLYVYELLREDPDSRRATMTVFSSLLDHHPSKDIPCTLSLQFLLREGRLSLVVNMRSSDVYLGLPYDVQQFTFLQQLMAHWLEVEVGPYYHIAGSGHVYESDLPAITNVLEQPDLLNDRTEPPVDIPYGHAWQQVDAFFTIEKGLRLGRIALPAESAMFDELSDYLKACVGTISDFIQRRAQSMTELRSTLTL